MHNPMLKIISQIVFKSQEQHFLLTYWVKFSVPQQNIIHNLNAIMCNFRFRWSCLFNQEQDA